ncbi:MAG: LysM domain-containing protein [Phycisphaerae bacterium]|jgi:5'-nucleotidase|nr:LysM domain-containing protein [Phycisphaerae bacterium]
MKNVKYAALVALLISSMTAGCNNGWNPFRKKPVTPDPPVVNVATMDNTALDSGPIRPTPLDTTKVSTGADTALTSGGGADPITVDPPTPPTTGATYTIKKKDTLWSISTTYLGSGKRWPEIVSANPGLDPKKLPIGKTIKIPPK